MCAARKPYRMFSALTAIGLTLMAGAYPFETPGAPNLEPPRNGKPYPPIMVPKGGDQLLSLDCPVTSSAGLNPERGEWAMITDNDKDSTSFDFNDECESLVKYAPGIQWIQIDLRTSQVVNAVWIWRHHWYKSVYRDVVVQLSDDADFIDGVTTVFNNDHDNSSRLGIGEDKEYIETIYGRPIPVPGIRARYVRVYSNGRYRGRVWNADNYCTEIEVYGGKPTSKEKVQIRPALPMPGFS